MVGDTHLHVLGGRVGGKEPHQAVQAPETGWSFGKVGEHPRPGEVAGAELQVTGRLVDLPQGAGDPLLQATPVYQVWPAEPDLGLPALS